MDRDTYLARWSTNHGGYDPRASRWVLGWLKAVYLVASPLARWRVPPDLLTASGLVFGTAVVASASAGGQVLDSFVDRCTDLLMLAALWVLGAPPQLCIAAGALTLLQESARATASATGLRGVGVLTVWERPSRIILATLAFLAAGVRPASADTVVTLGAGAATALATVGVVQLLVSIHRRLS
jgi:CDP-diacylglycerol--glycerol-3-phosphate 3-phosphatidyltransferase